MSTASILPAARRTTRRLTIRRIAAWIASRAIDPRASLWFVIGFALVHAFLWTLILVKLKAAQDAQAVAEAEELRRQAAEAAARQQREAAEAAARPMQAAAAAKGLLLAPADVAILQGQGIADPGAVSTLTDDDFGLRPRPFLGCGAFRPKRL